MSEQPDNVDLHLATVVVNVLDMHRAVAFWRAALGYEPRELQDPDRRRPPVSLQ